MLARGGLPLSGAAEEAPQPVLRALLVTCDRFVSRPETTPAAQQNAQLMKSLLESDARGYAEIRTECDTLSSVDAFALVVRETFAEAADSDISFVYISTHGLYTANRSNLSASLLLSDGEKEERLTAQALANLLAAVPDAGSLPETSSASSVSIHKTRCTILPPSALFPNPAGLEAYYNVFWPSWQTNPASRPISVFGHQIRKRAASWQRP